LDWFFSGTYFELFLVVPQTPVVAGTRMVKRDHHLLISKSWLAKCYHGEKDSRVKDETGSSAVTAGGLGHLHVGLGSCSGCKHPGTTANDLVPKDEVVLQCKEHSKINIKCQGS